MEDIICKNESSMLSCGLCCFVDKRRMSVATSSCPACVRCSSFFLFFCLSTGSEWWQKCGLSVEPSLSWLQWLLLVKCDWCFILEAMCTLQTKSCLLFHALRNSLLFLKKRKGTIGLLSIQSNTFFLQPKHQYWSSILSFCLIESSLNSSATWFLNVIANKYKHLSNCHHCSLSWESNIFWTGQQSWSESNGQTVVKFSHFDAAFESSLFQLSVKSKSDWHRRH